MKTTTRYQVEVRLSPQDVVGLLPSDTLKAIPKDYQCAFHREAHVTEDGDVRATLTFFPAKPAAESTE